MTSFSTAKSDLPEFASKQLKDKLVSFFATDLRPFTAVEGEGFLSLCHTLVEYGAKFGQFDARKNMPSRTTISRHVDPIVNVVKKTSERRIAESQIYRFDIRWLDRRFQESFSHYGYCILL